MKWVRSLLAVLLLSLLGCSERESILEDNRGHQYHLSDFSGKWIIVNYWAEWCDGCQKEIQELNQFYHDSAGEKTLLLGVAFEQPDGLLESIRKMGIQFPVLIQDPANLWHFETSSVLPVTYIVGPDGTLQKTLYGPQTASHLTEILKQLQGAVS